MNSRLPLPSDENTTIDEELQREIEHEMKSTEPNSIKLSAKTSK